MMMKSQSTSPVFPAFFQGQSTSLPMSWSNPHFRFVKPRFLAGGSYNGVSRIPSFCRLHFESPIKPTCVPLETHSLSLQIILNHQFSHVFQMFPTFMPQCSHAVPYMLATEFPNSSMEIHHFVHSFAIFPVEP